MTIRVALNHLTEYHYDRPVSLGPQVVRLRPAPHCRTPIISYSLKVQPADHFINWQQDPQSNQLARLVFPKPVNQFGVEVDLVADMTVINPFDFFLDEDAQEYPFEYSPALKKSLRPYLAKQAMGQRFRALFESIDRSPAQTNDFIVSVNQLVNRSLDYTIRMSPGVYTPERLLKVGVGSCRDFAWLLVHLFRRCGLAARFVSGYSIQLAPDIKPLDPDAPAGVTEDVCDLHAWCEVYLPGAGWVGLDATSGLMCGEGHIPLATGADAGHAAPIEGAVSASKVDFNVAMTVTRIHEDPRVTKPYSPGQWQSIDELGQAVDQRLAAGDVRLSMGGEPTFVSIEDQEGEEWNTGAVGPTKKPKSDALIRRLRQHFAPGGLLHYGQGKWYPGEQLPRWAIGLYWRRDGVPIWEDDQLIGDETRDDGCTHEDAERFIHEFARQMEVDDRYVVPAFEDPVKLALRERELPINVDPLDSKLDDPEERQRLLRVFERGLNAPVGYVLPIERNYTYDGPTWHSGMWMLRGQRLYLSPGDSPIGLRLPLESLPWVSKDQYPFIVEADPIASRGDLPARRARIVTQSQWQPGTNREETWHEEDPGNPGEDGNGTPPHRRSRRHVTHIGGQWSEPDQTPYGLAESLNDAPWNRVPKQGESAHWVMRTALCVEAREGRLYVFMPPARSIEDYLDLVAAIEHTAATLGKPVLIEGYTPPFDPRVESMKVTPDPGVIEVNIQPATRWSQMTDITKTVYDAARQERLGTEKFQLDGRHTGTGGGNHIVIGGLTPADSPFLRRPDLLKSIIGYWANHPSLSYLFSGMFIGPTSQAPRIDEGRPDAAYEMDIAFGQVPTPSAADLANKTLPGVPPWIVDRVFRHLLTDLTGNTHRAEVCIDKLYSPDSATGRLGLVEFRGFEMPPHWKMSLAQQLLLRALIAHFWETPYTAPLTRWGTRLHDRYLLAHYVWDDFKQVLRDLQAVGMPFQEEWFQTHLEFRFPVLGTVSYDGVEIEVRHAIEPWLVLGEEATAGGTARYVDSSLERLQVKVRGAVQDRHAVTVNGIELPLTATDQPGEFVAGVRFRAWQPPNCLHPTIPVHAPLVFDLVDRSSSRAIGGCTYHVSHPGGRAHEIFPINALEAETRRVERFQSFGHTPGPLQVRQLPRSAEMPVTLDLRRVR
ncbi:MAG: transglutaminase family protein [Planctomycetota bacterium]